MKKLLFLISFFPFLAFAKDIECQVKIQPESFGIDDLAYLIISANKDISNATFSLPNSSDVQLRYESQSSQARWINGVMEYSSTLYFRIIPTKTGNFYIPEFQGNLKGKTFKVPAAQFSVLENNLSSSKKTSSITLLVQGDLPQKLYVGQCYPIQVQLITPTNLRGNLLNFPQKQGDAFSVSHLVDTPQKTTVNFKGQTASCLFWPALVTTLQSGTFPLSFSIDMEIEKRMKTRRLFDDDPLDLFTQGFGGMFGQNEPISIQSKQKNIQVLPLPSPQPKDFSHAIGSFQLSTPVTKEKEFIQNEPLTLVLKVGGQGNFENIQAPVLEYDADLWRVYDPKSSFEAKDFLGYEGSLTFEYTLVPLKEGSQELPKASFCFFNPKTDQYESVERTASHTISIKPAIHTTSTSKIISTPNIQKETETPKFEVTPPTIFIDKINWYNPISVERYIYFFIGLTLLFCYISYRNYRQKNDKKYIQKKMFKTQFNENYHTLLKAFKQQNGTLFYTTLHVLLELLFKEKNINVNTMLSENNFLSSSEKTLLQSIEQTYHETKFGGKQCSCPKEIISFKALIKKLK